VDGLGERLRRGDESALEAILYQLGPIVASGLRRRYVVLNSQDVEDILATALYRLWRYRKKYDPAKASLKALLCRIADNVAKNLFRLGWQKLRQQEVEVDAYSKYVCPQKRVSGTAKTAKLIEDLQQVLAKLPAVYRHIVLADAYARDRVADSELLADELDIPSGTVRVYRNRAMTTIRLEMRKRGYKVP
jgi:RNA polymerase sigma factor (sigma-70 family)